MHIRGDIRPTKIFEHIGPQQSAASRGKPTCQQQVVESLTKQLRSNNAYRTMSPPHWFATPPPPQVWGAVHDPQSTTPPHPSPIWPHWAPAEAHVMGVHDPVTHWLLMHTPEHGPQLKRPPQPSPSGPHVAPCA
jgi:hypothetical protein